MENDCLTGTNRGLIVQKMICVCVVLMFCDISRAFSEDEDSEEVFHHPRFKQSQLATDEIRCNCNLPECVTTGYMCKSVGGGCFSEVIDHHRSTDVYNNRHGCLQKSQRDTCKTAQNLKLSCCFKDMCNQIGRDRPLFNASYVPEFFNTDGPSNELSEHNMAPTTPGYNSNEVWFKAAIIAVPICGIVILILLIFLAVKILRTDTLNTSSKLGSPYSHGSDRKSNRDHFDHIQHQSSHSLKKVPLLTHHNHSDVISSCTNHSSDELQKPPTLPLLVQNPTGISYDKKNEANAKINSAQNEFNFVNNKENNSPLLGLQKPLNFSNNVYRNVNLSFKPTPATIEEPINEKLYEKQALHEVISWGTPSQSSSPV